MAIVRTQNTASTYMITWQSLALSSGDNPFVLPTLGQHETGEWILPYNLYTQVLLGLELLNNSVCAGYLTSTH